MHYFPLSSGNLAPPQHPNPKLWDFLCSEAAAIVLIYSCADAPPTPPTCAASVERFLSVLEFLTTGGGGVAGWLLCRVSRGGALLVVGIEKGRCGGRVGVVVQVSLGARRVLGRGERAAGGYGAEGAEGEDGGVVRVAGRWTAASQVLREDRGKQV